ncbi:transglutaminase domain-containing protein [Paracoccus sp. N5]|uniref:transglutaminase domain-containing protein n=1 Tax=Paracoccus sp. N5 TaxID=1101189 RepID=UPI0003690240|nr:transglutaminase domain-containing protein [Paracoccus sp. N5]
MITSSRRRFLTVALAGAALPLFGIPPRPARAEAVRAFAPQPSEWQGYRIVTHVALPADAGPAQVWLPAPSLDTAWQKTLGNEIQGNATEARIVKDAATGAAVLHARFDGKAKPELSLISYVETRNRSIDWSKKTAAHEDPAVLQAALRPSGNKPLDGLVAETAARITQGAQSDVEKVRALYTWIVAHCYRNLDTPGCGPGDAVATLTSAGLGGKCADLNGLFVALARASGVPARDIYGIRVAPSAFGFAQLGAKNEVITGAQHCRAEVWLSDYGWVAMDPADVLKVMRAETDRWIKDPADPVVTQVNDALFGNWEGNWVGYNTAEDLALPGRDGALPFLMYPQGDVGARRLDELDAKAFTYDIIARPLSA